MHRKSFCSICLGRCQGHSYGCPMAALWLSKKWPWKGCQGLSQAAEELALKRCQGLSPADFYRLWFALPAACLRA